MFGCVLGEKGRFWTDSPRSQNERFLGGAHGGQHPRHCLHHPHPWRAMMQMMLVMRGMLSPRLGNVKNGSLGVFPLWWSHPFCPEKCMNMSETPLAVRLLSAHVCVFTRGRGRWSVSNASPATGAFSPRRAYLQVQGQRPKCIFPVAGCVAKRLNPATGRDRAAGHSPVGLTFRYIDHERTMKVGFALGPPL